jgi:hypothetical protein
VCCGSFSNLDIDDKEANAMEVISMVGLKKRLSYMGEAGNPAGGWGGGGGGGITHFQRSAISWPKK